MTSDTETTARPNVNILPLIEWDDTDTLRPGIDYRDGIVYVTLPAKVNVTKKVKRGKEFEDVIEQIDALACVTSDGRQFPFTPETVSELGYSYPQHVTMDRERRWSTTSIKDFLFGEPTPPNPAMLHEGLKKVYTDYVEFADPAYEDIMPLFIMGSYVFRLFRSLGYIHFNGTAASGKSQNLSIISALAFNAKWASSMSASSLYRQLAGMPGVISIDEAEGWDGERGEELRRILNSGYLDGSTVHRTERGKDDMFVNAQFESFGPKVIASINPLDAVIGSRCLIVAMRPALRRIPEFNKDAPQWPMLRDRLYLWTMFHSRDIEPLVREWNEVTRYERANALVGRQWQITQMYVVLADYIDRHGGEGGLCDRLIAFFNDYFSKLQKQQDATDRIRLVLKALPRVLANHQPEDGAFFYLKTIHSVVVEYLEEDQKEYYKTRGLAKHLDVLGFKRKRSHKQGTQIWLDPAEIRQEFLQRRVEPYPEDEAWLAGTVEHNPVFVTQPTTVDWEEEDVAQPQEEA